MTARVVDLFSGLGGTSTGAEMAGCRVLWAGNHWRAAVDAHALNHPDTKHACQDLHQMDWSKVPAHDLLAASPSCTGHSPARGKEQPRHDGARSTAWAVVSCAEVHRPRMVVVENVPALMRWVLYPAWRAAMEALGYALSEQVLDAADCGVPQNRERLFVVGVRGKRAVSVPRGTAAHVPASQVVNLDDGMWTQVNKPGRSPRTLARVARGRAECGRRFVMPYYGRGSGLTGRSLDRPLGTITTLDRWAIVDGDRMRMLTVNEYRLAMGFPSSHVLTGNRRTDIHLLGNAVPPPLAAHVIRHVLEAAHG